MYILCCLEMLNKYVREKIFKHPHLKSKIILIISYYDMKIIT